MAGAGGYNGGFDKSRAQTRVGGLRGRAQRAPRLRACPTWNASPAVHHLANMNCEETPMTLTIDLPDPEQYAAPDWLRRSWDSATQAGLDRLSADEIDAEIAAARLERSKRPVKSGA
jgi:hypothetical protein